MSKRRGPLSPVFVKRVRGIKKLVFDAVEETTNLVERTHESAARRPLGLLESLPGENNPAAAGARAIQRTTSAVYDTIRFINRGIDRISDTPFALVRAAEPAEDDHLELAEAIAPRPLGVLADQIEGVLNGAIGDFLLARDNPLGVELSLRSGGEPVAVQVDALSAAFPRAQRRVCVFVHGLAGTEWSWSFFANEFYGESDINYGSRLECDLDITPLYVRYNSGRHVSLNGRELSSLLESLTHSYPGGIDEITLIGHSMGGLVARSAAHYALEHDAEWLNRLQRIVCIASPNLGAPLEQAVNVVSSVLSFFDVAGTQVPAQIINARSEGIKDLRFGYTLDAEWQERDCDALLENHRGDVAWVDRVAYFFIAGHLSPDPLHPSAWLLGDLLVRLPSAGGVSKTARMPFRFGKIFPEMHHLHLLNHPDVYALLRQLCEDDFAAQAQI